MDYYALAIAVLESTIRVSIPLIFAGLAGLFTERSGVFDIGLEGKMLGAAFGGAAAAAVSGSVWVGLLAAIGVSVALALVHGFASITQRGNQIVSGLAINFFAAGTTIILGQAWFAQGGRTPPLTEGARFWVMHLPFTDTIKDIAYLGPIYEKLIGGQYLLTYFAFAMVPISWWILYRTRFGLRLRAVGENPGAVDTAGISVVRMRYYGVICAGILCGLAGAYLSLSINGSFVKGMTAGKGYVALAALIFAKWRPVPLMFVCLLFGFLDAVAILIQGKSLPIIGEVSVQFIQALPYVLTVILLAGFIGKAIAPKAGGVPYVKER